MVKFKVRRAIYERISIGGGGIVMVWLSDVVVGRSVERLSDVETGGTTRLGAGGASSSSGEGEREGEREGEGEGEGEEVKAPGGGSSVFGSLLRRAFGWRRGGGGEEEGGSGQTATIRAVGERGNGDDDVRALDIEQGDAGSSRDLRNPSNPVCLICLETLNQEDFVAGRAIALECECRGDLALRHRDCAIKWAEVKDSGRGGVPTCELCKKPVRNLPALPARPQADAEEDGAMEDIFISHHGFDAHVIPTSADIVFDCVRVVWVAMIISLLFFDAGFGAALWTGIVAGFAYIIMLRVMYRQHFEAMRAYAERHIAARQQLDPSGGQIPIHIV